MAVKKIIQIILIIALITLFSDLIIRTYLSATFNSPYFKPGKIYLHYYPELREFPKPSTSDNEFKILVLGGSVVYDDTVSARIDDEEIRSTFCNLRQLLPSRLDRNTKVYSLAQPAHTSLDSWYKYKLLRNWTFDLVIIYHGINDTRANNCPPEVFNIDYRHIAFYNELYVLFRHPEINFITLPYFFDLLTQRILIRTGLKETIPKDFSRYFHEKGMPQLYQYGDSVKTVVSFKRNLERILSLADQKDEPVLLSTYAFYLAKNYTLENFEDQNLDYAEQVYPIEIYGSPANVVKGIKMHNRIVQDLSEIYPNILFSDLNEMMSKDGQHFNDICHLTDEGCDYMVNSFVNVIAPKDRK